MGKNHRPAANVINHLMRDKHRYVADNIIQHSMTQWQHYTTLNDNIIQHSMTQWQHYTTLNDNIIQHSMTQWQHLYNVVIESLSVV
jgi:hypothetical protein